MMGGKSVSREQHSQAKVALEDAFKQLLQDVADFLVRFGFPEKRKGVGELARFLKSTDSEASRLRAYIREFIGVKAYDAFVTHVHEKNIKAYDFICTKLAETFSGKLKGTIKAHSRDLISAQDSRRASDEARDQAHSSDLISAEDSRRASDEARDQAHSSDLISAEDSRRASDEAHDQAQSTTSAQDDFDVLLAAVTKFQKTYTATKDTIANSPNLRLTRATKELFKPPTKWTPNALFRSAVDSVKQPLKKLPTEAQMAAHDAKSRKKRVSRYQRALYHVHKTVWPNHDPSGFNAKEHLDTLAGQIGKATYDELNALSQKLNAICEERKGKHNPFRGKHMPQVRALRDAVDHFLKDHPNRPNPDSGRSASTSF